MRLRKLREEHPGLELEHRAFILVAEGSRSHFTEYHLSHRKRAGELTGLPFSLPAVGHPYPHSSWPAQQAALWVQQHRPEALDDFNEAIFRAFFVDDLDISDLSVLKRASGMDDLELAARQEVQAQYLEAVSSGIRSIPSVIFGGRVLSGAVEYDIYKEELARLEP